MTASSPGAPNFDRLARTYRWLEYLSFGPMLWRCRTRYLAELAGCRRALVLGDGDGRFTAQLLRSNPHIQIVALDGSAAMIAALEQGAARERDRLTTRVADLRTWAPEPGARFDLVVSHFFLDCLTSEEVAGLAAVMSPSLDSGALWLISEFAVPKTLFGRVLAAPLVWSLYRAFRVLTGLAVQSLPDHQRALTAGGWRLKLETRHLGGLLVSQLWQLASQS